MSIGLRAVHIVTTVVPPVYVFVPVRISVPPPVSVIVVLEMAGGEEAGSPKARVQWASALLKRCTPRQRSNLRKFCRRGHVQRDYSAK